MNLQTAMIGAADWQNTRRIFASGSTIYKPGTGGSSTDVLSDIDKPLALGAGEDDFAIQHGSSGSYTFFETNANLGVTCGPIAIDNLFVGKEIMSLGDYWLGISTLGNMAHLTVIQKGCGEVVTLPLTSLSVYGGVTGSIAVSPNSVLAFWQASSTINFRILCAVKKSRSALSAIQSAGRLVCHTGGTKSVRGSRMQLNLLGQMDESRLGE